MPTTFFTVQVRDLADRQHQISEKCDANPPLLPFHAYPGGAANLPVIELDIKIPVYRMENYRTKVRQLAYIRQNDLAPTFFSNGQEDQEAQRIQHAILVVFAESGKGDSVMAIKTALEKDAEQTEPLLLTREGVIVNGNRRLAAMRELFAEESGRYAKFCAVRAMILPAGITSDELRRIEVRLQMQPATLLPYDWAAEALAVRDLREREFSNTDIATLMRLDRPTEVDVILDRLAEAEIYLSDYLGTPEAYDEVMDQQQQFIELQKGIKSKSVEAKEISRQICHVLTKNSRALGNRAYQYKAAYGSKTEDVLERLAEELGVNIEVNEQELDTDDHGSDDVFGGAVAVDPAARFQPLKEILSDTDRSTELAEKIGEICDDIKELEAERNVGTAALRQAVKANTALTEISLDAADPTTLTGVKSQLESAVNRATSLLGEVDRLIGP